MTLGWPVLIPTVLSTSLGKTFSLAFYSKYKHWFLIDNVLSGTIFLSIFLLCFQIFTVKLILWPKMGLTYAISTRNFSFEKNLSENIFLFFFYGFKNCENFRNFEQEELDENLLQVYLPYQFLLILLPFLLWEQTKIFQFFKSNV